MSISTRKTSSLQMKSQLFAAGLRHALHDGFWALVPVAIVVGGISFIIWFWQDGPTDLLAVVGVRFPTPLLAKLASTFLVGFPTLIFAWQSFNNFLLVLGEKAPLYREFDQTMDRINDQDQRQDQSWNNNARESMGGKKPGQGGRR